MNRTSASCILILLATTASCAAVHEDTGSKSSGASPKPALSTLTVYVVDATRTSITLSVCAGATGASAGFSLHWVKSGLVGTDGAWPGEESEGFCHASFSGNASESRFDLAAYACSTIEVGALATENGASFNCSSPLECGTEYAFRAFGHGGADYKRSEWSTTVRGSTDACDEGCTYTQGYWKNHTPFATKNSQWLAWPVSSTRLGSNDYTNAQLVQIFDTPVKGNGLVSLAHQLAAAKLNIASGASGAAVATTITAADALIGSRLVPSVGAGYLEPAATSALTKTLTNFNEGWIGPGHCDDGGFVPPMWTSPID